MLEMDPWRKTNGFCAWSLKKICLFSVGSGQSAQSARWRLSVPATAHVIVHEQRRHPRCPQDPAHCHSRAAWPRPAWPRPAWPRPAWPRAGLRRQLRARSEPRTEPGSNYQPFLSICNPLFSCNGMPRNPGDRHATNGARFRCESRTARSLAGPPSQAALRLSICGMIPAGPDLGSVKDSVAAGEKQQNTPEPDSQSLIPGA